MNLDDWKKVKALVDQAAHISAADRPQFLDDHCPLDLRAEVMAILLSAEDDEPRLQGANEVVIELPVEGRAPVVEGFSIIKKIGEGGMGVVYLAEQDTPRRQVALKVLKWGWADRTTLRRFRQEMQVLATLNHPGIAGFLESGVTADNRPWFTMDFCSGVPIDHFFASRKYSVEQILHVFLLLCQAISNAHRKLIIHRDLKPSNILVSESEDGIQVKVIDFGISKALAPILGSSMTTGIFCGSPQYMAPELFQVTASVDVRSDVWSIGVVLYQVLGGRTPFGDDGEKRGSTAEIIRAIQQDDPILVSRSTKYPKTKIRGDLDAIALMALRKDPDKRYQSVEQLAEDILAFLENRPIKARKSSWRDRVWKRIQRNKGTSIVTALALLTIGSSLVFSLHRMRAEQSARKQAEASQAEKVEVATYFKNALGGGDTFGQTAERDVFKLIESQADALERLNQKSPTTAFEVHDTLVRVYLNNSDLDRARYHVEKLTELLHEKQVQSPEHEAVANTAQGNLALADGHYSDAECYFRYAQEQMTQGSDEWVVVQMQIALAITEQGRFSEAEQILTRALDFASESRRWDIWSVMGIVFRQSGHTDRALETYISIRDHYEFVYGASHVRSLTVGMNIGFTLQEQGRYSESIDLLGQTCSILREQLGDHSLMLQCELNLFESFRLSNRLDEALELGEQTVANLQTTLGPAHDQTLRAMNNLALVYKQRGDLESAIILLENIHTIQVERYGRDHPGTLLVQQNIGNTLRSMGHLEDALAILLDVHQRKKRVYGPNHRSTLITTATIGEVYLDLGDLLNAKTFIDDAVLGIIPALGEEHEQSRIMLLHQQALNCCLGRFQDRQTIDEASLAQIPEGYRQKIVALMQKCCD